MSKPRKYEAGDRVNKWTIIEYPFASKKVLVRCDCGEESWRYISNIYNGKSKGCWECSKTDPYLLTMESVKRTADRRSIAWGLTLDEWRAIAESNCHYCSAPPSNCITRFGVKYNGVDRVDTTMPYTADNCVPACRVCNRAKSDMSYEDFLDWMREIVKSPLVQQ